MCIDTDGDSEHVEYEEVKKIVVPDSEDAESVQPSGSTAFCLKNIGGGGGGGAEGEGNAESEDSTSEKPG